MSACGGKSALRGRIALSGEDRRCRSRPFDPQSAIHLRHRSLFRVHSWFEISPKESALRGRIALPSL